MPTRVGECEKAAVGVATLAEVGTGRWDRDGDLAEASVQERALVTTAAASVRFNRQWQVGLNVPTRLNRYSSSTHQGSGGGLADLRALVLWDPVEEKPRLPDTRSGPVPIVMAGTRLATGRDWTESRTALHEDVTGLEQSAALAGVSLERTLDDWPWSIGAVGELGAGSLGLQPALTTNAFLGRYLGTRWTVMGGLAHRVGKVSADAESTRATTSSVQVIHGKRGAWRAWTGATVSLPIASLGRSQQRVAQVGGGLVIVR